mmetsp:Transcript_405/g.716  ORF Transcript_405/g.716 Transcript_405/m.716 type:complete len:228 (+) Transcript_405:175-858(+)
MPSSHSMSQANLLPALTSGSFEQMRQAASEILKSRYAQSITVTPFVEGPPSSRASSRPPPSSHTHVRASTSRHGAGTGRFRKQQQQENQAHRKDCSTQRHDTARQDSPGVPTLPLEQLRAVMSNHTTEPGGKALVAQTERQHRSTQGDPFDPIEFAMARPKDLLGPLDGLPMELLLEVGQHKQAEQNFSTFGFSDRPFGAVANRKVHRHRSHEILGSIPGFLTDRYS